mmetsp:Transcript_32578/g.85607  ORF Transcript_32578/g.85607 Transcript_32578/m.85607 type:complete len:224 (+) Transcript_32578:1280-1951(+)
MLCTHCKCRERFRHSARGGFFLAFLPDAEEIIGVRQWLHGKSEVFSVGGFISVDKLPFHMHGRETCTDAEKLRKELRNLHAVFIFISARVCTLLMLPSHAFNNTVVHLGDMGDGRARLEFCERLRNRQIAICSTKQILANMRGHVKRVELERIGCGVLEVFPHGFALAALEKAEHGFILLIVHRGEVETFWIRLLCGFTTCCQGIFEGTICCTLAQCVAQRQM